jgi:hypothetical protein
MDQSARRSVEPDDFHKATLWRQAARILSALDALDRGKPQERRLRYRVHYDDTELPVSESDDC